MDMISEGKGTAIGSSMFPAFEKYFMPELSDMYAVNLEKAKELLKEAGYENGFSFTITVPSNYQQHIDTAQVLVEQLKKIGVTADINLIEWDSWLSDVYAERNYQATVVGVDASALTAQAPCFPDLFPPRAIISSILTMPIMTPLMRKRLHHR